MASNPFTSKPYKDTRQSRAEPDTRQSKVNPLDTSFPKDTRQSTMTSPDTRQSTASDTVIPKPKPNRSGGGGNNNNGSTTTTTAPTSESKQTTTTTTSNNKKSTKPITQAEYVARRVDTARFDARNRAYAESRVTEVERKRAQKEYERMYPGTFQNEQGQGFSADPNLVLTGVSSYDIGGGYSKQKVQRGESLLTYGSGRTEVQQTGTVELYGKSTYNAEIVLEKKKSLAKKGYENISVTQEGLIGRQQEILKAQKTTGKPNPQIIVTGATLAGIGFVKGVTTPILYPKETIQGIKQFVVSPIKSTKETFAYFKSNPTGFAGEVGGGFVLGKIGSGAVKFAKQKAIPIISKTKVSTTKVFAPEVVSGANKFPVSKSLNSALKDFNKGVTKTGTIEVVSASPSSIKTLGQSRFIKVGEGTPGNKRTTGLYAAPKGRGSPYFLGITEEKGYSFSILPKFRGTPTVSLIEVSGVKRIPKSVLLRGVASENKFLRSKAGTGYAFITGNLEGKFNKQIRSKRPFVTSETEVVIPVGSYLRQSSKSIFGFEEYTTFENVNVPIRKYKVGGLESKPKFNINLNRFKSEGKLVKSGEGYTYSLPKKNISATGLVSKSLLSSKGSSFKSSVSIPKSSVSNLVSSKSFVYSSKPTSYSSLKNVYSTVSVPKSTRTIYGVSRLSNNYFRSSTNSYNVSYKPNTEKVFTLKSSTIKFNNEQTNRLKKIGDRTSKNDYRYVRTIESQIFNIKAPKISKELERTYRTGLVNRPIITG